MLELEPGAETRPGLFAGIDPGRWPLWRHLVPLVLIALLSLLSIALALRGGFGGDAFVAGAVTTVADPSGNLIGLYEPPR